MEDGCTPARNYPVVSEEDMYRILSVKGLHPSRVVALMDAYSRGLIRCYVDGVVIYYRGRDKSLSTLGLASSGFARCPFDAPREKYPWILVIDT